MGALAAGIGAIHTFTWRLDSNLHSIGWHVCGHIMKRSSFPGSPTACWTKSSKETQHSALHGGYVKEVKKLYARRNA